MMTFQGKHRKREQLLFSCCFSSGTHLWLVFYELCCNNRFHNQIGKISFGVQEENWWQGKGYSILPSSIHCFSSASAAHCLSFAYRRHIQDWKFQVCHQTTKFVYNSTLNTIRRQNSLYFSVRDCWLLNTYLHLRPKLIYQ